MFTIKAKKRDKGMKLDALRKEGEIPAVYRWPYDYSKPGSEVDFIPQNIPFSATPESNFPYENEMIKEEKEIEGIKFDYSIPD